MDGNCGMFIAISVINMLAGKQNMFVAAVYATDVFKMSERMKLKITYTFLYYFLRGNICNVVFILKFLCKIHSRLDIIKV